MTQSTTTNGYTQTTMNSTDVYNYMKRIARNTFDDVLKANIDCLAEALIQSYGDDTDMDKRDLKAIAIRPGYMSDLDFRTMECEVITSMSTVPFSVAHVD
jgi:hypothetical protein